MTGKLSKELEEIAKRLNKRAKNRDEKEAAEFAKTLPYIPDPEIGETVAVVFKKKPK